MVLPGMHTCGAACSLRVRSECEKAQKDANDAVRAQTIMQYLYVFLGVAQPFVPPT